LKSDDVPINIKYKIGRGKMKSEVKKVKKEQTDGTNIFTEIETRNLIHKIISVSEIDEKLDRSKDPPGYPDLLKSKDPNLKKIINFFLKNPEAANILLTFIGHIETDSEQGKSNRDKNANEYVSDIRELLKNNSRFYDKKIINSIEKEKNCRRPEAVKYYINNWLNIKDDPDSGYSELFKTILGAFDKSKQRKNTKGKNIKKEKTQKLISEFKKVKEKK